MSILNRIFIYYFIMQIARKRSRKHNVNYLQDAAYYIPCLYVNGYYYIFRRGKKIVRMPRPRFRVTPATTLSSGGGVVRS